MALNKPGSNPTSRVMYRLYATHNPTQTAPSFLLPIFCRPPDGNALYAQRLSLNAETILGFEAIPDTLKSTSYDETVTVRVDHPAIHAFETPSNDVIVGTRSQLQPKLTSLVSDRSLFDRPSLRLDIVEFCNLDHLISEAADDVYRFLHSVSSFSATYWRDQTFLAERARRNLWRYIASREIKLDGWSRLGGVTLSIKNGRPVLMCSAELYDSLKPDIDWEAWAEGVKEALRFHIGAFAKPSQLQFVVGADAVSSEEARVSSTAMGAIRESWLVAPFGQTAVTAAREVQRRGIAAAHIDTSRGWNREAKAIVSAAQQTSRKQEARTPILLMVMSSSEASASVVLPFLKALPSDVRAYGIVLHRTQDGLPSHEMDFELFRSKRFERIIVIPDNDFPIGEASVKTSRGTLLVSLIGALDRVLQGKKKIPRGRSIYSMAWTRSGLKGYEVALARCIAAAANPWLSIGGARRAMVSLSSVGRPDGGLSDDVAHQLNATLFQEDRGRRERRQELVVETEWIQRRFLPGANIPATVELFLTGIVDEPQAPEERLVEAARIVLAAAGYDVRSERNGNISISHSGEDPLLIAVRDAARSKRPAVYVQLMPNKRSQKGALAQHNAWKGALPLMLGDLYFLANVKDPLWTATLLAHLAQPKKLWRDFWKGFVQQSFQREMRRNDNYRNLWLKEMPKSAVVSATAVEIESTERLAGRQAKIAGKITLKYGPPMGSRGGRSETSKSAGFEVKFGPDEFNVVKLEQLR